MIVGQTHRELLQFYSAHLSASQRRLVSLFSQKFCRCASAVENCSFFHICLCASQGNCLVCFCQKIRPCASHEESCSFLVQHMLVCVIGETVADFYTKLAMCILIVPVRQHWICPETTEVTNINQTLVCRGDIVPRAASSCSLGAPNSVKFYMARRSWQRWCLSQDFSLEFPMGQSFFSENRIFKIWILTWPTHSLSSGVRI